MTALAQYHTAELEVRFLERVHQRADGCWDWTSAQTRGGYGQFWFPRNGGKARSIRAHRWAYEQWVAPIPEGLVLDHLCRRPICVNPAHLEPVTDYENVIVRGVKGPTWENANKTHCLNGHPFDEANTAVTAEGYRRCRTCHRDRQRTYRQAAKVCACHLDLGCQLHPEAVTA